MTQTLQLVADLLLFSEIIVIFGVKSSRWLSCFAVLIITAVVVVVIIIIIVIIWMFLGVCVYLLCPCPDCGGGTRPRQPPSVPEQLI